MPSAHTSHARGPRRRRRRRRRTPDTNTTRIGLAGNFPNLSVLQSSRYVFRYCPYGCGHGVTESRLWSQVRHSNQPSTGFRRNPSLSRFVVRFCLVMTGWYSNTEWAGYSERGLPRWKGGVKTLSSDVLIEIAREFRGFWYPTGACVLCQDNTTIALRDVTNLMMTWKRLTCKFGPSSRIRRNISGESDVFGCFDSKLCSV